MPPTSPEETCGGSPPLADSRMLTDPTSVCGGCQVRSQTPSWHSHGIRQILRNLRRADEAGGPSWLRLPARRRDVRRGRRPGRLAGGSSHGLIFAVVWVLLDADHSVLTAGAPSAWSSIGRLSEHRVQRREVGHESRASQKRSRHGELAQQQVTRQLRVDRQRRNWRAGPEIAICQDQIG